MKHGKKRTLGFKIGNEFMRFEKKYGKYVTVLEGAELSALLAQFFALAKQKKFDSFQDMLIYCSGGAYTSVHGIDLPPEKELAELNTPDSRKMDLFFRGMGAIFHLAQNPNELPGTKLNFEALMKSVGGSLN